jgi:uncharacterized membrane protein YgcG
VGVAPASGPFGGNQPVTVQGANLTVASGPTTLGFVIISGPNLNDYNWVSGTAVSCSATSCSAATPEEPPGTVHIVADVDTFYNTPGGADQYTFNGPPSCTAVTSCPPGWNDTPPEITITCPASTDFYEQWPAGEVTYIETAPQYVGDMTGSYNNAILACQPGQGIAQCARFPIGTSPGDWCGGTGNGSSGGSSGGSGGGSSGSGRGGNGCFGKICQ